MDPNIKMVLIGVSIGLAIAVVIYYYTKSESYTPAVSGQGHVEAPKITPQLVLFYSDGCGHCQRLAPTWSQVEEHLSKAPNFRVKKIEAMEPETALGKGVKGWPTIRLYPQGLENPDQFIEYSGDRSLQDIIKFATQ